MKKNKAVIIIAILMQTVLLGLVKAQDNQKLDERVNMYFEGLFGKLKTVAEQEPTVETFREVMKPVAKSIDGFYGATLVDSNWVIRQVYSPAHFLARGFDLKKVKELEYFYKLMQEKPGPQLSEPGHGSLLQPRLISLRYPIIKDRKFKGFISLMVETQYFLKATRLDEYKSYKIICLGKLAEEKGKLASDYKVVNITLPSTEWMIQYSE